MSNNWQINQSTCSQWFRINKNFLQMTLLGVVVFISIIVLSEAVHDRLAHLQIHRQTMSSFKIKQKNSFHIIILKKGRSKVTVFLQMKRKKKPPKTKITRTHYMRTCILRAVSSKLFYSLLILMTRLLVSKIQHLSTAGCRSLNEQTIIQQAFYRP